MTAVLAAAACDKRTDHERAGDRRYAEAAWRDAAAEYRLALRLASPSPELFEKLGAASLHADDPAGAVEAYARLARSDPAAVEEAADGLVRAARAAIAAHDIAALKSAVAELRKYAPIRLPVALAGAAAAGITLSQDARTPESADILLAAAAGARSAAVQESLLVAWADAISATDCDAASRAYANVVLRAPGTSAIARSARGGLAACAVQAGRAALSSGALDSALAALGQAVAIGTPDSVVRLAWLLTGDAWWTKGDSAQALEAYRKAIAGGDEASPTVVRAIHQLAKLTGVPDTAIHP